MKIFLLILLLPAFASAQHYLPKNKKGDVEFIDAVATDSVGTNVLLDRARMFVRSGMSDATNAGGQVNDQLGEINLRGYMPMYVDDNKYVGDVQFALTISCKGNGYVYSVGNLQHYFISAGKYLSGGSLTNDRPVGMLPVDTWNKVKINAANKINSMIFSLRNYMDGIAASDDKGLSKN